ncbi:MAG: phosphoribosylformylglycinamidine synthase subunit PurL [Candidatus Krumholzibacteriia bacterium]
MALRDESFDPVPVGALGDDALRQHLRRRGLTLGPDEARRVAELLGRDPNLTEMTLFDTMWSEHCSYKSSRTHLKRHLPANASNVVVGPVEDAGVVDFGEVGGRRYGIVIAHESHNHPSQVMPVEGAATGIGGIVRDVYCMGAEVIGCLDPLRFGWPLPCEGEQDGSPAEHRREIAREVVTGIWQYANAIGVPNLGGDVVFHPSFNENCLVNVVALGIVETDRITHSAVPPEAASEPYELILVGKPTDWSGMGGAAFASATLDAAAATENRGSVQTPDPFLKRILTVANRAVLDLARGEGARIGFKDLGAGGVSCVTSELCDAGGFGCDVDLALVHAAGDDIPARVVACSETQERYGLAVPARLVDRVLRIYNEDFALPSLYEGACARRIGRVTTDRRYVLRHGERVLADAPVETITEGIRYERPAEAPERTEVPAAARLQEAAPAAVAGEWLALMAHPNVASREWIYRHYDSEVQGNTILRPGEADAGVLAPLPNSRRAVAVSADGNPLLGLADPYAAGVMAVVEACRNVACVGGEPAAITDCLNFGNPEVPRQFWQFTEAVRGIGDACRGLGRVSAPDEPLPVISGNVSFYNQSASGRAVAPSPIVACVGVVDDHARCRSQRFKAAGDAIYLVGVPTADLEGSLYRSAGFQAGRPAVPPLDLAAARAEIGAVLSLVRAGLATAVHDISDGGLAICLTEMAVGLEGQALLGAAVELPRDLAALSLREALFSERGGFVLTCAPEHRDEVEKLLSFAGCAWWPVGEVTAELRLRVSHPGRDDAVTMAVADLARAWQAGVPRLLGGEEAAGAVAAPAAGSLAGEERAELPSSAGAPTVRREAGPRVAVVQLPGVNCEDESQRYLERLGARAEIFRWTRPAAELARFDGYLVPGGFSYQDRVRAGAVAAKDPLLDVLQEAASAGKPILGICNGCQVLVEAGLVPGREQGAVEVALAANRFPGRRGYHARWVNLAPVPGARTPFLEGWAGTVPMPMAHAEGRFTHEDPEVFRRLLVAGHVALRYVAMDGGSGGNPNGSLLDCAALASAQGNVLAMMPHPERAALLRMVPEDLPHPWGALRRAAVGDRERLEQPGPGAFLLRRLIAMC